MFVARSRFSVIGATVLQIVIFSMAYWTEGFISNAIKQAYGYD